MRTNAFVSGGFVPPHRRGKKFRGVMSIADWCRGGSKGREMQGECKSFGRLRAVYQALLPGTGANPRLTYLAEDSHTGIYRHTSELKKQVLTMGPPSFFRELPLAPAHNQRPRYL